MKVTVLTTCALLSIGAGLGAVTARPDRVVAQGVKIEPGKKTVSKPTTPTPTPRKPIVGGMSRRAAPEIEMVFVPGGSFLMGSPENEPDREKDEGPQHRVTVSSFYIGKYEVTQAQWRAVMGNNPSVFIGNQLPVELVSWNEVKDFCGKLSQLTGEEYRLPTEAEWEYACRAKSNGAYAGDIDAMGWYRENSDGGLHRVGRKQPNALGLYDMHGNVSELSEDDWHDSYANAPNDGSAWVDKPSRGTHRVFRGGGWLDSAVKCRSAFRGSISSGDVNGDIGFRLVRTYR